jgi:ATP-dependent DNA helicase PIF1
MYQNMQQLKLDPNFENIGTKWTEEEILNLLQEVTQGLTLEDMALLHKRTVSSIRGKLYDIADKYINHKKMDINEVSKIVRLPVIKINEYLLKKMPKKIKELKGQNNGEYINGTLLENTQKVEKKVIRLNTEQQLALETFKKGQNLFLTGPAGTGKSVTLNKIIEFCESKGIKYGVTATTGTAAFLIGGKTLHSFLGIGLAKESAKEIFEYVRYKLSHIANKLRNITVLIIDEISMLEDELFIKISQFLSFIRRDPKPFGGLHVVFTGDFCQLEPVSGGYCFKTDEWVRTNLKTVYLHKLIRQDGDIIFQNMLSKLRYGKCTDRIYEKLLTLKNTEFGEVKPTILYPKNYNVDIINKKEYAKLIESGAQKSIYKIITPQTVKNKEKALKWVKSLEIPESVELCIGAQVVVLANINQDAGIVNGTRGIVIDLRPKTVVIKRTNDTIYEIEYHKSVNNEDPNIHVSFMPLKLAYALTIHRSQGMTLDAVEIDIGSNIFAAGQAYTALSRAQNLNSVKIKDVNKNSFIVNQDVLKLYKDIEDEIKDTNEKYVKKVINNMIYRISNHIELEKSLNFLQDHFVLEDDDKTFDYFDTYEFDIIKIDTNEYNTLVDMINNCKELMIQDIEYLNQQLEDFHIKLE